MQTLHANVAFKVDFCTLHYLVQYESPNKQLAT